MHTRSNSYSYLMMNSHCYLPVSRPSRASSENLLTSLDDDQDQMEPAEEHTPPPVSILVRAAMRISRARWFSFLRRVFQYQNGARSDLRSNPFNTGFWLALELLVLAVQTVAIMATWVISRKENPVWPLRVWIAGYNLGNVLHLPLLYWRFRHSIANNNNNNNNNRFSDLEYQQINTIRESSSSSSYLMNKCRTCLELFFAIWFVMGNVWVFDSRFGSFENSPNLHILCISLLAWNAVVYSFPFLLFVLLCCCVPFVSSFLGYNMNMGSVDRAASNDQISSLPHWKFHQADPKMQHPDEEDSPQQCCICLTKYLEEEEVRQLPCSHLFHLKCVDKWLRIISCCPLCKKELER